MSPLTHFTTYAAILRLSMRMTEKLILCLILTFEKNGLKMNNSDIGQALNVSGSTVANTLSILRKKELIQTEKASSKYRKIYPHTDNLLHLLKSEVEEVYLTDLVNLPHSSSSKLPHSLGSEHKERSKRKDSKGSISCGEFMTFWNDHGNLPKIITFTPHRKKALATRSKEPDFADNWKQMIDKISQSAFCTGHNDRGWKADVEWLLGNSTNYIKVLEGKYDNSPSKSAEPDYSAALAQHTRDVTEEEAEELLQEVEA